MEQILDMMERLLKRYDVDAKECAQRLLCSTVRQASENVSGGIGSSADKVIDGVTRFDSIRIITHWMLIFFVYSSNWMQKWTHGSSIQSTLQLARSDHQNCEDNYDNCLVSSDKLELFVRQMLDNF